jgi:tape measure domain-containing protein
VAESLGSAVLTLSVDDRQYNAGLQRAKQSADQTLGSIKGPSLSGGLFGNIAGEVKGLSTGLAAGAAAATGAAVAVGAIGVALVQAAGDAQKLTAAFAGLTGSATAAAQLRQELFTLSKATPFRNDELLGAAQRFLAVGVEADKLGGTINRIGALAAQSGQSLDRVGLIYAQVFAKGRLQGEENLQFLEAGIDLNDELARVTGLSGTALQDAMSKGKISINDVNNAIVLATGNMSALVGAGQSVSVQFANIGDNIQQVFLGFAQAVSPALSAAFQIINQAFDRLFPSLKSITEFFKPLATEAKRFADLLDKNPRVVEALALAFESLLSTAIKPVTEGLESINEGLEKKPTGLVNSIVELELRLRRAALSASGLAKIITAPARPFGLLSGEARAQLLDGLGDIEQALTAKPIEVPIIVKPKAKADSATDGELSAKDKQLKADQALRASSQLELGLEKLKLEAVNERIAAAQKLGAVEKGVVRDTLQTTLSAIAAVKEAKRNEREIGLQITSARQVGNESGAARLVAQQQAAAQETKLRIIEGATALRDAGKQLAKDAEATRNQLQNLRIGNFQFLSPKEQKSANERAFAAASEEARLAGVVFTARGTLQERTAQLQGFADFRKQERQLLEQSKAISEAITIGNTALVEANQALDTSIGNLNKVVDALTAKNWSVNVDVYADGSSQAYGDVVNGAVSQ